MNPFVSICIPAYKRVDFLVKLLDSIVIQTYRNFEVVVSDDSADESVASLIGQYNAAFSIQYRKNAVALGTPANWNAAISMAKGEWIKLMHDDDWFTDENSLQGFVSATEKTNAPFIFSGFYRVDIETQERSRALLSEHQLSGLRKNPYNIIVANIIGHPSTTMVRNTQTEWYDERVKWVVDIEYYSRFLTGKQFYAIPEPLVCIGMSSQQVTKAVFRKPEVEIPENLYLLNKLGTGMLRSVSVYDYFWRFVRNLGIRNKGIADKYRGANPVPPVIDTMIHHQQYIPQSLLMNGMVSKSAMLLSYLYCRFTNKLKANS